MLLGSLGNLLNMQNFFLWTSIFCFVSAFGFLFTQRQNKCSLLIGSLAIFVYIILGAAYIVADYFTGEGINDAVIFHLYYGLEGAGVGDYYSIIFVAIGLAIVSLICAVAYYRFLKAKKIAIFSKIRQWFAIVFLGLAFLIHPSISWMYEGLLAKLGYENSLAQQYDFNKYYQAPSIKSQSTEDLNLVYIFAESFELTYFDEKIFPSLIKHLRPLQAQSINFTNIQQTFGTGWTIAGMTAALCGIPLVTPSTDGHATQGNSMSKMTSFYSGATCMSDVLHKEGYNMVYRSGSSLIFAGVDKLYKTHQFDDAKGIEDLESYIPKEQYAAYHTPWGFYDDTLFDLSFNEFEKLAQANKKFALFVSTMDTHHPDGHISKSCKTKTYQDGSNSILNAVACSDELIANFIKKIQSSPYGKNTVIVVGSDHLAMYNTAADYLSKGKRSNQFMILDPRQTQGKQIDKIGSTLDISAILLPLLGFDTPLGLGRNLLADQQSLMAEVPDFDKVLSAWQKSIAGFWNFPRIQSDVMVNAGKKMLAFDKTQYEFPIALRLDDSFEVSPFFEVDLKFFDTKQLFEHVKDFAAKDPFIWVDACVRVGALDEKIDQKAEWCLAYGKLGSDIITTVLDEDIVIKLSELTNIHKKANSEDQASQRKARLAKVERKVFVPK